MIFEDTDDKTIVDGDISATTLTDSSTVDKTKEVDTSKKDGKVEPKLVPLQTHLEERHKFQSKVKETEEQLIAEREARLETERRLAELELRATLTPPIEQDIVPEEELKQHRATLNRTTQELEEMKALRMEDKLKSEFSNDETLVEKFGNWENMKKEIATDARKAGYKYPKLNDKTLEYHFKELLISKRSELNEIFKKKVLEGHERNKNLADDSQLPGSSSSGQKTGTKVKLTPEQDHMKNILGLTDEEYQAGMSISITKLGKGEE